MFLDRLELVGKALIDALLSMLSALHDFFLQDHGIALQLRVLSKIPASVTVLCRKDQSNFVACFVIYGYAHLCRQLRTPGKLGRNAGGTE